MKVAVLHEDPERCRAGDAPDVLAQRDAVVGWLRESGHEVRPIACSLDLQALRDRLAADVPDVAFNLVEALDRTDRLMPLVAWLVEARGIPMTGCPALAMQATTDKLRAKHALVAAGLPVPTRLDADDQPRSVQYPARGIVKAVWEHASFGLHDDAVTTIVSYADARAKTQAAQLRSGYPHFCEAYIAGREFNLSLLEAEDGGPRVLAPAEIDFSGLDAGKPAIVGQRAKWDPESHEYAATPRTFDFPPGDAALVTELTTLARRCWDVFALAGYARVDFRVDEAGRPYILEVNANPCLSPDAGYLAAAVRSGIDARAVIDTVLRAATRRCDILPGHALEPDQ